MATLTRRRVLQGMAATGGVAAAGSLLPAAQAAPARTVLGAENWDPDVFAHSVASGDPTASAVIIWTRVTPGRTRFPATGRDRTSP